MRRLWNRFLLLTRVTQLVGVRQGAYLSRLFRMFERGDVGEALRHAIPLGGDGAPERLDLGVPSARERLEIAPGAGAPSLSFLFGGELYFEMQRLYRRGERPGRLCLEVIDVELLLQVFHRLGGRGARPRGATGRRTSPPGTEGRR